MGISRETAKVIERMHNVVVDTGFMMYNRGVESDYGWRLIPDEWVREAEGKHQSQIEDTIKKLEEITSKVESLDDPTAPDAYRELIGDAHYCIEECISVLKRLEPKS